MRFNVLFFLLFNSSFIWSQDPIKISLFDKLYTSNNIELTLTYPFDSLNKTKSEEIEARISIRTDSGFLLTDAPLTINIRGKFRRMKCTMPPLLLNFKKSTLKELNLSAIDEMKLVTHCIEGPEGIDNMEEELLIYQLYETLTPLSYRTIWLSVKYCNMSNPVECVQSVGFLLEPDKVVSSRLGIIEKKLYNMAEDSIHYVSYSRTAAFNFLIGNRDWSVVASRNAKLFYDPQLGKYVVIPYDFDYANIVGATYRRETLPKAMKHPFDRIYQGEYFANKSGEILKSFYACEKPVLDAVNSAHNPMDQERKNKIYKYLDSWFRMVKNKKADELPYGTICPYAGGLEK